MTWDAKHRNAIHHGIVVDNGGLVAGHRDAPNERDLPHGFISDGDSFLSWGDVGIGEGHDGTLHVMSSTNLRPYAIGLSLEESHKRWREGDDLALLIVAERALLTASLLPGERLADYVVVTNREDFSEDQETFTIEHFRGKEAT